MVGPDMHLAYWTNRAGGQQFRRAEGGVAGAALHAHLGSDPGFARRGDHLPGLENRMGHWLRTIDVFAQPQCSHGDNSVVMIGRSDDHRVDVLFLLIEHLPEVPIDPRSEYF